MGWRRGFLQCQTLEVETSGMIATMYSTQKNSMTVSVPLYMWQQKASVTVLLDSGATHNFIDPCTIKQLHIGTRPLKQPLSASNVDGTLNQTGTITHFCNLTIRTPHQSQTLEFYVANIGSDQMIFGHPWFKVFNPTIDWTTNTLKDDYVIETPGYQTQKQLERPTTNAAIMRQPHIDPFIPEEYHHHWEVFDEEVAKHFPCTGRGPCHNPQRRSTRHFRLQSL